MIICSILVSYNYTQNPLVLGYFTFEAVRLKQFLAKTATLIPLEKQQKLLKLVKSIVKLNLSHDIEELTQSSGSTREKNLKNK